MRCFRKTAHKCSVPYDAHIASAGHKPQIFTAIKRCFPNFNERIRKLYGYNGFISCKSFRCNSFYRFRYNQIAAASPICQQYPISHNQIFLRTGSFQPAIQPKAFGKCLWCNVRDGRRNLNFPQIVTVVKSAVTNCRYASWNVCRSKVASRKGKFANFHNSIRYLISGSLPTVIESLICHYAAKCNPIFGNSRPLLQVSTRQNVHIRGRFCITAFIPADICFLISIYLRRRIIHKNKGAVSHHISASQHIAAIRLWLRRFLVFSAIRRRI